MNEEKVKEFCLKIAELETEYNMILWAYSGTGDLMVTAFNEDNEPLGDYEYHIEETEG